MENYVNTFARSIVKGCLLTRYHLVLCLNFKTRWLGSWALIRSCTVQINSVGILELLGMLAVSIGPTHNPQARKHLI